MTDHRPRGPSFVAVAVMLEGALAAAAIVVGWLIGFSPLQRLAPDHGDPLAVLLHAGIGALASLPMFVGLWAIDWVRIDALRQMKRIVQRVLVPLLKDCSLADIAFISLVAGIGEEVLFRGLVQDGIAHWIGGEYGAWIALAAASFAFGMAHAVTRTYTLLAALAGAYLGLLFIFTGSLIAPIVAHAVYDFGAMVYLLRIGALNSNGRSDSEG